MTIKLYINGNFISNSIGSVTGDTKIDTIGDKSNGSHDGGSTPWIGLISNVKVYDRELSSQEVKQNFNALNRFEYERKSR